MNLDVFVGRPGRRSLAAFAFAVIILAGLQLFLGWRIASEVNANPDEFDQGAYILMAKTMEGAWYPWYSDGTRSPLTPWLAAVFLQPGDPGFLLAAKRLNVLVGVAGTLLLAVFFVRRMGVLAAWNCTALGALAVLLPSSVFFGAETLFFVIFLLLFVLATRLLNENPLWQYALLGILAAAAYLAKPSATPMLAVFVACSGLRFLFPRTPAHWSWAAPGWSRLRFVIGMLVFGVLYAGLISPRLVHAAKTWGTPFYSLPSHWFWADDWKTCVEKYADCRPVRLREMPPEEQPTLRGYFLRHSPADAVRRIAEGASVRLTQFFLPEKRFRVPFDRPGKPKRVVLPHRGIFIVVLGLLAVGMLAAARVRGNLPGCGPVALPVMFFAGCFALYTAAMGWYLPIGPGHRFILTLFLPALWFVAQAGETGRRLSSSVWGDAVFAAFQLGISAVVVFRLGVLLRGDPFEKILHTF